MDGGDDRERKPPASGSDRQERMRRKMAEIENAQQASASAPPHQEAVKDDTRATMERCSLNNNARQNSSSTLSDDFEPPNEEMPPSASREDEVSLCVSNFDQMQNMSSALSGHRSQRNSRRNDPSMRLSLESRIQRKMASGSARGLDLNGSAQGNLHDDPLLLSMPDMNTDPIDPMLTGPVVSVARAPRDSTASYTGTDGANSPLRSSAQVSKHHDSESSQGGPTPGAYQVQGRAIGSVPAWVRRVGQNVRRANSRNMSRSSNSIASTDASRENSQSHLPPEMRGVRPQPPESSADVPAASFEIEPSHDSHEQHPDVPLSVVESVSEKRTGLSKRSCIVIAIAAIILLGGAGVGMGMALAGRKEGSDTVSDGAVETRTLSPTPVPPGCDSIYVNLPVALRSCLCTNGVRGVSNDLLELYSTLKREFVFLVMSDFDYDNGSCHPRNLALYWLAEDIVENDPPGETWKNRFLLTSLFLHWTGDDPFRWNKRTLWLTGDSECMWFGVTCSTSGEVEHLRLPYNNLFPPGGLPEELFALTGLSTIDLSFNELEIPSISSSISNLLLLDKLDLSSNDLGAIPPFRHFPGGLVDLNLSFNQVADTIPSTIGSLTNLVYLRFTESNLRGTLPSEIGLLTQLRELRLSNNGLQGLIPSEIGSLTLLETLDLSVNLLATSIFTEIGGLLNLVQLHLNGATFSGTLPTELGLLSNLKELQLRGPVEGHETAVTIDGFGGTIPSEIGLLSRLVWIDFSDNNLVERVPTEIGLLQSLETLNLGNNLLTGPIPSEVAALRNLRSLRLRGMRAQRQGDEGRNEFSGTFPPELADLEFLICFDASETLLYGVVPEGLCDNPEAYINVQCVGTTPCSCCSCEGPDRCDKNQIPVSR